MKRKKFDIARRTLERLMRDMGIQGVMRGKKDKKTDLLASVDLIGHQNRPAIKAIVTSLALRHEPCRKCKAMLRAQYMRLHKSGSVPRLCGNSPDDLNENIVAAFDAEALYGAFYRRDGPTAGASAA